MQFIKIYLYKIRRYIYTSFVKAMMGSYQEHLYVDGVSRVIQKLGITGGNPAKVFKDRDKKHYERLKKEEKFI